MKTILSGGLATLLLAVTACDDGGAATGAGGASSAATTTTTATGSGGGEPSCLGTQSDDPQFAQALEVLRKQLDQNSVAGGAISVVKDGKIVGLGVIGTKRAGVCEPVTEDTLFGLPYVSETLTAIAALDAVEDGKLSLTAPITSVIGPLPADHGAQYVGDITLHHLLTHTSMYTTAADAQPQQSTCTSLAGAYATPVAPIVEAPPGSMYEAEDRANTELTALALQVVDGKPYPEVMAARVLGPLGLEGTFDLSIVESRDHAQGYSTNGGEAAPFDCPNHHASYGYYGSVRDLAKLGVYLTTGGPPLAPPTFETMLSEQEPSFWTSEYTTYATIGWKAAPAGDGVQAKLGGTVAGFNGGFLVFPARRLAIGVVFNRDHFATQVVASEIAKIYGFTPGVDTWLVNEQHTPDPAGLPSLVGTYVDPIGFKGSGARTLVVSQPDAASIAGTLSDESGNSTPVALTGVYAEDNYVTDNGIPVRFWRDASGVAYAVQPWGYNGPPFFRVP